MRTQLIHDIKGIGAVLAIHCSKVDQENVLLKPLHWHPFLSCLTCAEGDDDEEVAGGQRDGTSRTNMPGVVVGTTDGHAQPLPANEMGGLVSIL